MPATPNKTKSLAATLLVAAFACLTGGCAIHSQAPIREVAYDFSDHQFYDRAYAPSPAYAGEERRVSNRNPAHYGAVFQRPEAAPAHASRRPSRRRARRDGALRRGHRPSAVEAGRAPSPRSRQQADGRDADRQPLRPNLLPNRR